MNADGSGQRRLTRDARFPATPAWSPDGRKIAFEGVRDAPSGVYVVNADGSGQRRLARNGRAPAWSPDGRNDRVLQRLQDLPHERRRERAPAPDEAARRWRRALSCVVARRAEARLLRPGRLPARLLQTLCREQRRERTAEPDAEAGAAGSWFWWRSHVRSCLVARRADDRIRGTCETYPGHGEPIYVVRADGSGLRNLTPKPVGAYAAPAWSPDGRKLAFVSDRDGNSEVYVMNANGSGQRNLTRNPAYDADPAWSPDGRKIAFVSNRDGNYGVYVMNADGSGQRRLAQRSP